MQNLLRVTGYNAFAIGLAAAWGILRTPAMGAAPASASTVIVALNAGRGLPGAPR